MSETEANPIWDNKSRLLTVSLVKAGKLDDMEYSM